MILSERTISILKNFMTINGSIILEEGNVIRTMTPTKTIFAQAKIDEEIPVESAIYDLSKFMGLLSLNKNNDVDFSHDNHIIISGDRNKIKFGKANPALIAAPPKGKQIKLKTADVVFDLSFAVVEEVKKAMGILDYEEVVFAGEDGKLLMMAGKDDSDYYSVEIGETDQTFVVVIDSDKFKLLSRDYHATISKQGVIHLKSDDEIEYWLTISKDSRFE